MEASERGVVEFVDDEGDRLHATWSRSGKRLIVTVWGRGTWAQVELRPDQVSDLAKWLGEPDSHA